MIETSPIHAPGTRAMGQLDKQRQDENILWPRNPIGSLLQESVSHHPSRIMRIQQNVNDLCDIYMASIRGLWLRRRR